jgi:hypothetical protein
VWVASRGLARGVHQPGQVGVWVPAPHCLLGVLRRRAVQVQPVVLLMRYVPHKWPDPQICGPEVLGRSSGPTVGRMGLLAT